MAPPAASMARTADEDVPAGYVEEAGHSHRRRRRPTPRHPHADHRGRSVARRWDMAPPAASMARTADEDVPAGYVEEAGHSHRRRRRPTPRHPHADHRGRSVARRWDMAPPAASMARTADEDVPAGYVEEAGHSHRRRRRPTPRHPHADHRGRSVARRWDMAPPAASMARTADEDVPAGYVEEAGHSHRRRRRPTPRHPHADHRGRSVARRWDMAPPAASMARTADEDVPAGYVEEAGRSHRRRWRSRSRRPQHRPTTIN